MILSNYMIPVERHRKHVKFPHVVQPSFCTFKRGQYPFKFYQLLLSLKCFEINHILLKGRTAFDLSSAGAFTAQFE